MSEQAILDLRMRDLDISIERSPVADRIEKVMTELAQQGLKLRPHFWFSDEWACPDGVAGVAVPFYLAHPRLVAIERAHMLEAEGSNRSGCLRLLRHEVGHAAYNAYGLSRRKGWRDVFGSPARPYPDYYKPNPRSKSYVLHLPGWYAQSHPSEDFAETFAVWLRPGSRWAHHYSGWPAYRKLAYVDGLMSELAGARPRVTRKTRPYALSQLDITLREHYEAKRAHYVPDAPREYDDDLEVLFCQRPRSKPRPTAASFLRKHKRSLIEDVVRFAPDQEPIVDHVLEEMRWRCRELGMRIAGREPVLLRDVAQVLTKYTFRFGQGRGQWWPV